MVVKSTSKNKRLALFWATLTVSGWTTVATAFKLALELMTPIQLLFWATLIAWLCLGVFVVLNPKRLKTILNFKKHDFLKSLGLGALNPAIYYVLLFNAYDRLEAQQAQPINMTWPLVLVVITTIMQRNRLAWQIVLPLLLSFLGILIIVAKGDFYSIIPAAPLGVLLALASTLPWAFYWYFSAKDNCDPISRLWLNFSFGLIIMFVVALANNELAQPTSLFAWSCVIWVGLFEMGLTFVCWLYALKYAETPDEVSNMVYLVPFLSLIPLHYFVNEVIHPATLLGLILIVGSILWQQWINRAKV